MKRICQFISVIVMVSMLAACGSTPAATEQAATDVESVSEPVQTEPTEVELVSEPVQTEPTVGGTWVYATDSDPDTLDIHFTVSGDSSFIMKLVSGSVLALDPETQEFVPYLAESYSLSEDGLTWEIKFKDGMKWHDGTPFTAEDYVWTLERVMANPSPATGAMIDGIGSVEAIDDLTVRILMDRPNSGMLYGLTTSYTQPLPKAYIERVGAEEYSRNPIGIGPFMFKEWRTGDRIILERNPDFNWGPPYAVNQGAPYIEFIEIRTVPEYATRLAGIESGEIDLTQVRSKDIERVQNMDMVDIFPYEFQGAGPYLLFNLSQPPFDDILVRKAFNLAINREELVQVVLLGHGAPLWGVIAPATYGHWDGDKEIGYGYDLEQAKALMEEAGYALNSEGILEKDGQPLVLEFKVTPSERGDSIKTAQVLIEQFKDLGVVLELQQLESGVWQSEQTAGNYTLTIDSWGWAEAQILMPIFHSSQMGGMNVGFVNDLELDPILLVAYMAPDRETLQQSLDEAQRYIIEKAYVAPLYSVQMHVAISKKFTGIITSAVAAQVELFDAYLVNPE